MKISFNEEPLFELTETQKKVICNDIIDNEFEADMKRRLQHVVFHKYEQCLRRFVDQWMPILKQRVASIPVNDDELARLIFSQPDYKCRRMREEEAKANK